jgi:peptide/nickel transport system substrate-binding protein
LLLDRRTVLAGAAALGLSALSTQRAMAQTPTRGGTLRVGLIGGGASVDTLDPHAETLSPELSQSARQLCFSKLADMAPDGSFVLQLAEAMEPNADTTVWRIKLKSGITFHDGSELTADDVIYTFRRILDPKNDALANARGNIDMIDPNGLEKVDKTTLNVKLTHPWSDLISAVGQRYISIIKNGANGPWTVENFIGTGPFKLTEWVPGERYTYVRNEHYFEDGKPYLDGVVTMGIQDPVARVNALIAGQVDCICDVAPSQAAIVQGAGLELIVNPGGGWTPIVMDTTAAPFDDVRVRQAMKLLVNRQQSVDSVLQGYGTIGNDVFARWDPLYNADLPQQTFDPDKAKFLLKQAGQLDTTFDLHGSDADANMMPLALVFAQGAKQAGPRRSGRRPTAKSLSPSAPGATGPSSRNGWRHSSRSTIPRRSGRTTSPRRLRHSSSRPPARPTKG